ncbi:hypothetical protein PR003_g28151 [Phytophthora rubi]|uniref:Uncharacterized protein n=4 Tax=Phytophthora TaxID=4783 RepID=A0A6A3MGK9_9STRA|nr:hypothetical protein PR002_g27079 [Phytophthora rubi]KAE9027373.1 hypothetical protein PF011_g2082 [Phytophthora fragariae]KAE9279728.1 hypothetical protein PR003_g28151 [Phytophthora rubi]KAE9339816.1 hypothetical protein PF008_g11397 [Phytophthora fragariae]
MMLIVVFMLACLVLLVLLVDCSTLLQPIVGLLLVLHMLSMLDRLPISMPLLLLRSMNPLRPLNPVGLLVLYMVLLPPVMSLAKASSLLLQPYVEPLQLILNDLPLIRSVVLLLTWRQATRGPSLL